MGEEITVGTMRPKEFLLVHILCILRQEEGTIQRRIRRLLLVGAAIELRRPHIPHPIGDGSTQPHELMAQCTAPRAQILLRESHRARQISLPLHSIGIEIAQHIVLPARSNGAFRDLLCRSILLRAEQSKHTAAQGLTVLIHTIVMMVDRL